MEDDGVVVGVVGIVPGRAQEKRSGKYGPEMRLRFARCLSMGWGYKKAAQLIGVPVGTAKDWYRRPDVRAKVEEYRTGIDREVMHELALAELEAVGVMRGLMVNAKDERVKKEAAESILNRAGRRGVPVERKEHVVADVSPEVMRSELAKALADPGVRQWLGAVGDAQKLLGGGEVGDDR